MRNSPLFIQRLLLIFYLILAFSSFNQLISFLHLNLINMVFMILRRAFPIYAMIPILLLKFPHVKSSHIRFLSFTFFISSLLFSLYQWRFIQWIGNYQMHSWGLFWTYHALSTYLILFIIQLVIYLNASNHLPYSLLLSFYGCFIAGVLYELPIALQYDYLFWSYQPSMIASYVGFCYLLFKLEWHLRHKTFLILSIIPLIMQFPAFSLMPYWMIRLTPFPLFLIIALGVIKDD